ncbi:MAG: hypothetical protein LBT20_06895, partial [Clostridiales bacterium]|nr:hypothetical protein [Clostridiales bacterium]
ERSVNVLLNLFAAVDCLFIFYSNNVNVFKITLSLYLVFGVSTLVWVAVRLFHGKYDIYSVFSEIRVSLIVMAAVLLTHGVLLVTNKVTPDETLESAYMFFGTAALVLQLTEFLLLKKNVLLKIASALMFLSGFIYGIMLVNFFGNPIPRSAEFVIVLASIFGVSTLVVLLVNIFKFGKYSKDPMAKIYLKGLVLAAASLVMGLLFVEGATGGRLGDTTVIVFFIVAAVLAAALLVFMLITYRYEAVLPESGTTLSDKKRFGKKKKGTEEPIEETVDADAVETEAAIEETASEEIASEETTSEETAENASEDATESVSEVVGESVSWEETVSEDKGTEIES